MMNRGFSPSMLAALSILIALCNCDSPTADGGGAATDGPGPITAPRANARVLAGDTIDIAWTNEVQSPVVSYNFNDTAAIYNDAQWHPFADSEIVSINSTSARVRIRLSLYATSNNFQVRVEDSSSGEFAESGAMNLDHIVLLSPVNGESFAAGQSVPIRFKRDKFMDRVYVHFMVGAGDETDFSLTAVDVNFDERGLGSVSSVFDTTWVIGTEGYRAGKSARYPSDACFFYVFSYYLGSQFRGNPVGVNSDHNEVPFEIAP